MDTLNFFERGVPIWGGSEEVVGDFDKLSHRQLILPTLWDTFLRSVFQTRNELTNSAYGYHSYQMNQLVNWLHKIRIVLLVGIIVAVLDLWTKMWAHANLQLSTIYTPFDFAGDAILLQRVHNDGSAFGIIQDQWVLYSAIGLIMAATAMLYFYYLLIERPLIGVLVGLQFGGALGNLIDRLSQGFVTDFIKTGFPNAHAWPNYNVADVAIICGIVGLCLYALLGGAQTDTN